MFSADDEAARILDILEIQFGCYEWFAVPLRNADNRQNVLDSLSTLWHRYSIARYHAPLQTERRITEARDTARKIAKAISLLKTAPRRVVAERYINGPASLAEYEKAIEILSRYQSELASFGKQKLSRGAKSDPVITAATRAAARIYTDITGSDFPKTIDYVNRKAKRGEKVFSTHPLNFVHQILNAVDSDIDAPQVATAVRTAVNPIISAKKGRKKSSITP
ncbi:hypothetical protein HGP17_18865 [Rhizobium sp. P38BS-XIX]|uniref:hypothetical protein n=1 Tax=Rhizobium sp. P38BS-XIX TaxID=2726740 RepID=UPI0014578816|nr:hypothetical protein [Rhizobium sp. P38BS-XIX]NLR98884.1 hypothetical protein [Rhizobium sp. P38BS-XIX]